MHTRSRVMQDEHDLLSNSASRQNSDELFCRQAALWAYNHACTCTPWIYSDPIVKQHTLVDSLTFIFSGMSDADVELFWTHWNDRAEKPIWGYQANHERRTDENGCVVIAFDRNTYSKFGEIFDFVWEPLKLIVSKRSPASMSSVAFEDSTGRRGRTEYRPCNPEDDVHVPKDDAIPWLPLPSSIRHNLNTQV